LLGHSAAEAGYVVELLGRSAGEAGYGIEPLGRSAAEAQYRIELLNRSAREEGIRFAYMTARQYNPVCILFDCFPAEDETVCRCERGQDGQNR